MKNIFFELDVPGHVKDIVTDARQQLHTSQGR